MPNRGGDRFGARRLTDIRYDGDNSAGVRIDDDELIANNEIVVALIAAKNGRNLRRQRLQLDLLRHGGADREGEVDALQPIGTFTGEVGPDLLALRIRKLQWRRALLDLRRLAARILPRSFGRILPRCDRLVFSGLALASTLIGKHAGCGRWPLARRAAELSIRCGDEGPDQDCRKQDDRDARPTSSPSWCPGAVRGEVSREHSAP